MGGGRHATTMDRPSHKQGVYPRMDRGRLDRQAVPPGQKQRGLDAELHAEYQASKTLDSRNEGDQDYTILSDSTAAITRARSDKCWWCGQDERQTRHHLFVNCAAWKHQIKELWKDVGYLCG